ncbi:hypothetical protein [Winogradskyella luteola]|uniref:Lipocalin-like domain-containing protein n=1 Tax=Winogradskyella luteola TaxID=2828330 RepID=A0A9X1FBB2_9FLAO|nr:hypothetical protein [Winogradskyella luteola]MBV7269853.1 hypothetical protein [Winogradskyella luteola]
MKIHKLSVILLFAASLLCMQCDDDDDQPSMVCDFTTIIDNELYQNAQSAFYSLVSAQIDEDCLNIKISSSGCSGETWVLELVDSGGVLDSDPPQRNLKFVLTNNEACLAIFEQERSFDLTSLQVEDTNEVILNVEDFPEPITYSY